VSADLRGEAMAHHRMAEQYKGNYLELFGGEPMPISRETVDEMR